MLKEGRVGDGEAGVGGGRCSGDGLEITSTIAAKHHVPGQDILDRKPRASNSIEQLLSLVN